jgi:hypothetical protein
MLSLYNMSFYIKNMPEFTFKIAHNAQDSEKIFELPYLNDYSDKQIKENIIQNFLNDPQEHQNNIKTISFQCDYLEKGECVVLNDCNYLDVFNNFLEIANKFKFPDQKNNTEYAKQYFAWMKQHFTTKAMNDTGSAIHTALLPPYHHDAPVAVSSAPLKPISLTPTILEKCQTDLFDALSVNGWPAWNTTVATQQQQSSVKTCSSKPYHKFNDNKTVPLDIEEFVIRQHTSSAWLLSRVLLEEIDTLHCVQPCYSRDGKTFFMYQTRPTDESTADDYHQLFAPNKNNPRHQNRNLSQLPYFEAFLSVDAYNLMQNRQQCKMMLNVNQEEGRINIKSYVTVYKLTSMCDHSNHKTYLWQLLTASEKSWQTVTGCTHHYEGIITVASLQHVICDIDRIQAAVTLFQKSNNLPVRPYYPFADALNKQITIYQQQIILQKADQNKLSINDRIKAWHTLAAMDLLPPKNYGTTTTPLKYFEKHFATWLKRDIAYLMTALQYADPTHERCKTYVEQVNQCLTATPLPNRPVAQHVQSNITQVVNSSKEQWINHVKQLLKAAIDGQEQDAHALIGQYGAFLTNLNSAHAPIFDFDVSRVRHYSTILHQHKATLPKIFVDSIQNQIDKLYKQVFQDYKKATLAFLHPFPNFGTPIVLKNFNLLTHEQKEQLSTALTNDAEIKKAMKRFDQPAHDEALEQYFSQSQVIKEGNFDTFNILFGRTKENSCYIKEQYYQNLIKICSQYSMTYKAVHCKILHFLSTLIAQQSETIRQAHDAMHLQLQQKIRRWSNVEWTDDHRLYTEQVIEPLQSHLTEAQLFARYNIHTQQAKQLEIACQERLSNITCIQQATKILNDAQQACHKSDGENPFTEEMLNAYQQNADASSYQAQQAFIAAREHVIKTYIDKIPNNFMQLNANHGQMLSFTKRLQNTLKKAALWRLSQKPTLETYCPQVI